MNEKIRAYSRILQESPRWLIANGKYKEARGWVQRAAKWNKKDASNALADLELMMTRNETEIIVTNVTCSPKIDDLTQETSTNFKDSGPESERLVCNNTNLNHEKKSKDPVPLGQEERLSILDIFRHRHLFMVSLIIWIVW